MHLDVNLQLQNVSGPTSTTSLPAAPARKAPLPVTTSHPPSRQTTAGVGGGGGGPGSERAAKGPAGETAAAPTRTTVDPELRQALRAPTEAAEGQAHVEHRKYVHVIMNLCIYAYCVFLTTNLLGLDVFLQRFHLAAA